MRKFRSIRNYLQFGKAKEREREKKKKKIESSEYHLASKKKDSSHRKKGNQS
jgi:hypothetical protein